jgi:hypothetical protein
MRERSGTYVARSIFSKVRWLGSANSAVVGLAVILALLREGCSANGITIPRDTVSREELTQPLYGNPVGGYENLRPGDLAYFAYHNGTGAVHHVGMYVADGKMIHAPRPGNEVSIVDIVGSGWIKEYAGAIRYT